MVLSFKIILGSVIILASGIGIGLSIAPAVIAKGDFTGLSHVGLRVNDFEKAADFYKNTMGFPEAFYIKDDQGKPVIAYFQIDQNTFIELLPASSEKPAGLDHFGLETSEMGELVKRLQESEIKASGPSVSTRTGTHLGGMHDPEGVYIELLEAVPGSKLRKAKDGWGK